jgi:hypothetical protein
MRFAPKATCAGWIAGRKTGKIGLPLIDGAILPASNRADNRLRTLVYMNMLNMHGLRTTIPQAAEGLDLNCIRAQ